MEGVYAHAMGLAGAMAKGEDAVRELVERAGKDRAVLASARRRTEIEAARAEGREDDAVGDEGPPGAPALLAARLLDEAIQLVEENRGRRDE